MTRSRCLHGWREEWCHAEECRCSLCDVTIATDLDVEVVKCEVVDIACDYPGTSAIQDIVFPMLGTPSDDSQGALVTRRTVTCIEEQQLKVTLDITYRVTVKSCRAVTSPTLMFQVPLHIGSWHSCQCGCHCGETVTPRHCR